MSLVTVTHKNKGGGGTNPLYQVMGSLALVAAAQTVWTIQKDESDETRRLMLCAKNNIGNDKDYGMAYSIIDNKFQWENDRVQKSAGQFYKDLDEGVYRISKVEDAKQWISQEFKKRGGSIWSKDIEHMAENESIRKGSLHKAKAFLSIISERVGFGENSKLYWRLPHGPVDPPEETKCIVPVNDEEALEAKDWIKNEFKVACGSIWVKDLDHVRKGYVIKLKDYIKPKKMLGIVIEREGEGVKSRTYYRLPDAEAIPPRDLEGK